jgi:hypothetical protein
LIDWRTPATGEGTSVSTLSVETSNSGSSAATSSPSDFSQRVIVPSVIDSPRAGMVTEVALPPPPPFLPPDDFLAAGFSSASSSAPASPWFGSAPASSSDSPSATSSCSDFPPSSSPSS